MNSQTPQCSNEEKPTRRIFHIGLSVRGALGWKKRDLEKLLSHEDGRRMSADEAREALMDELAKGHEMLPFGAACDNWCWKEGCKGHPVQAEARTESEVAK